VPITQKGSGELRGGFDQRPDERLEGGEVASPGPSDESGLQHHHP